MQYHVRGVSPDQFHRRLQSAYDAIEQKQGQQAKIEDNRETGAMEALLDLNGILPFNLAAAMAQFDNANEEFKTLYQRLLFITRLWFSHLFDVLKTRHRGDKWRIMLMRGENQDYLKPLQTREAKEKYCAETSRLVLFLMTYIDEKLLNGLSEQVSQCHPDQVTAFAEEHAISLESIFYKGLAKTLTELLKQLRTQDYDAKIKENTFQKTVFAALRSCFRAIVCRYIEEGQDIALRFLVVRTIDNNNQRLPAGSCTSNMTKVSYFCRLACLDIVDQTLGDANYQTEVEYESAVANCEHTICKYINIQDKMTVGPPTVYSATNHLIKLVTSTSTDVGNFTVQAVGENTFFLPDISRTVTLKDVGNVSVQLKKRIYEIIQELLGDFPLNIPPVKNLHDNFSNRNGISFVDHPDNCALQDQARAFIRYAKQCILTDLVKVEEFCRLAEEANLLLMVCYIIEEQPGMRPSSLETLRFRATDKDPRHFYIYMGVLINFSYYQKNRMRLELDRESGPYATTTDLQLHTVMMIAMIRPVLILCKLVMLQEDSSDIADQVMAVYDTFVFVANGQRITHQRLSAVFHDKFARYLYRFGPRLLRHLTQCALRNDQLLLSRQRVMDNFEIDVNRLMQHSPATARAVYGLDGTNKPSPDDYSFTRALEVTAHMQYRMGLRTESPYDVNKSVTVYPNYHPGYIPLRQLTVANLATNTVGGRACQGVDNDRVQTNNSSIMQHNNNHDTFPDADYAPYGNTNIMQSPRHQYALTLPHPYHHPALDAIEDNMMWQSDNQRKVYQLMLELGFTSVSGPLQAAMIAILINNTQNYCFITNTGSGKSLPVALVSLAENSAYNVAPHTNKHLTFVGASYKATLDGWKSKLESLKVPFVMFDPTLTRDDLRKCCIVLFQIEYMADASFWGLTKTLASNFECARFVFDEAHAIVYENFRPVMRHLGTLRHIHNIPTYFMSATLPPPDVERLRYMAGIPFGQLHTLRQPLINPNCKIHREVLPYPDVLPRINSLVAQKLTVFDDQQCIVIITMTTWQMEEISQGLVKFAREHLPSGKQPCVVNYHGNLTTQAREQNVQKWKDSARAVMVATPAFAAGVDHPMVDFVIMAYGTYSNINVVQAMGRGGRRPKNRVFDFYMVFASKDTLTKGVGQNSIDKCDNQAKTLMFGKKSNHICLRLLLSSTTGPPVTCLLHKPTFPEGVVQLCQNCEALESQSTYRNKEDGHDNSRSPNVSPPSKMIRHDAESMDFDFTCDESVMATLYSSPMENDWGTLSPSKQHNATNTADPPPLSPPAAAPAAPTSTTTTAAANAAATAAANADNAASADTCVTSSQESDVHSLIKGHRKMDDFVQSNTLKNPYSSRARNHDTHNQDDMVKNLSTQISTMTRKPLSRRSTTISSDESTIARKNSSKQSQQMVNHPPKSSSQVLPSSYKNIPAPDASTIPSQIQPLWHQTRKNHYLVAQGLEETSNNVYASQREWLEEVVAQMARFKKPKLCAGCFLLGRTNYIHEDNIPREKKCYLFKRYCFTCGVHACWSDNQPCPLPRHMQNGLIKRMKTAKLCFSCLSPTCSYPCQFKDLHLQSFQWQVVMTCLSDYYEYRKNKSSTSMGKELSNFLHTIRAPEEIRHQLLDNPAYMNDKRAPRHIRQQFAEWIVTEGIPGVPYMMMILDQILRRRKRPAEIKNNS